MENVVPPEHRSAPLGLKPAPSPPGRGGVRPSSPVVRHAGIVPRPHQVFFTLGAIILAVTLLILALQMEPPEIDVPTIFEDPRMMDLCRAYLQWQVKFGDLDLEHLKEFCPT